MPSITYSENFSPHRTVINGRLAIRPHLRTLYPYHIERPSVPDYDQAQAEYPPPDCDGIDVSRIRQWLDKCNSVHGTHCRTSSSSNIQTGGNYQVAVAAGGRPSFLIDVKGMCLVPAKNHTYLALSYVWGNASCVSLSSQTRTRLLTEGSLRQEDLPQTIRQALQLVELLGQTHLWIDRLCIDQHDGATKKGQIAAMADIYANSYLTIIAAENDDASKPLCPRGFRTFTLTGENHPNRPISSSGGSSSSPRSSIMEDLSWSLVTESTWSTRGWTFQEYYSARRKLIFHGNTVTWECHCEAWNERDDIHDIKSIVANTRQCQTVSFPLSSPTPLSSAALGGLPLSSWPDFHVFARLICLFNVRHLTYQSDALDAIEGLLSIFSTVFEGGFISGLPQMLFDAALLWQPYFPMERRRPSPNKHQTRFKDDWHAYDDPEIPPSWSYFGHYGSIHSEDLVATANYIIHEDPTRRLPATYTISTVKWAHSVSYDGERTPIRVSAACYREKYQGRHEDLPAGWHAMGSSTNLFPCTGKNSSRNSTSSSRRGRRSSIDSDKVHYFWHDGVGDSTQRFWYPVPILRRRPEQHESQSHTCRRRPRFLHGINTRVISAGTGVEIVLFHPQRQHYRGPGPAGEEKIDTRRCADAFLRVAKTGEWIGYMCLNQSIDSFRSLRCHQRKSDDHDPKDEVEEVEQDFENGDGGEKEERRIVVEQNCTLVELSRGSTTYDDRLVDRYVEYLYPEMIREGVVVLGQGQGQGQREEPVYEFVNVMWIELLNGGGSGGSRVGHRNGDGAARGMARRRGIGRVVKGAWGRLARGGFDVSIC